MACLRMVSADAVIADVPDALDRRSTRRSGHAVIDVLDVEARRAIELDVDVRAIEPDVANRSTALEHRSVIFRAFRKDQGLPGRWRQRHDQRGRGCGGGGVIAPFDPDRDRPGPPPGRGPRPRDLEGPPPGPMGPAPHVPEFSPQFGGWGG